MSTDTPIHTGNEVTDAVTNLQRLMKEFEGELELRDIFNYDELNIAQTPAVAIAFNSVKPLSRALGKRCNIMVVNLYLYLYLESLNLGNENFEHLSRLGDLVKILYEHDNLYNLSHSEPMIINSAALAGRALTNDLFLCAQVDLTIPVRFCVAGA